VHAISSAGVAHALTKACSAGELENCGCDRSLRGTSPEGFEVKFTPTFHAPSLVSLIIIITTIIVISVVIKGAHLQPVINKDPARLLLLWRRNAE